MTAWILLLFTLLSIYITLETLGVLDYFKEHPNVLYAWIWGKHGKYIHDRSPNDLRSYMIDRVSIKIAIVCVGITLTLAIATFKAFAN